LKAIGVVPSAREISGGLKVLVSDAKERSRPLKAGA
jgi:hypothetical protein